jgi:hypothetical protein
MATITYTPNVTGSVKATGKRSFFTRLIDAMIESRMRRAQFEIRRAQAMVGEPKDRLDYAMLPFAGE